MHYAIQIEDLILTFKLTLTLHEESCVLGVYNNDIIVTVSLLRVRKQNGADCTWSRRTRKMTSPGTRKADTASSTQGKGEEL